MVKHYYVLMYELLDGDNSTYSIMSKITNIPNIYYCYKCYYSTI